MASRIRDKFANPFYLLLTIVGVLFLLSACAYGVMAVQMLDASRRVAGEPPQGLIGFMARHGTKLLVVELAVLAVATVLAITTDDYWQRGRQAGGSGEASTGEASTGDNAARDNAPRDIGATPREDESEPSPLETQ